MSVQLRTLEQARLIISRLVVQHGVGNYGIDFVQKGRKRASVASCDWALKRLSFVIHYATHLTDEDFVGTVLHEIAHALTPGHGHDRTFRNMCYRIGGQPDAKTDYSYASAVAPTFLQKKINYIYKCPACANEMKTTKKLKRSYSCGKCAPRRFDANYIMVLTTERKPIERLQGFSLSA